MGIFQVEIVRMEVIPGGNFLWWEFPGWELSGGSHPGGNFPGRSFHVTAVFVFKFKYCVFGAYENSILSKNIGKQIS